MSENDIANLESRLKRNEEEHCLILDALKSLQALSRFDGAGQLSMNIDVPPSNGAIGKMSFNKGIVAVLSGAGGASLDTAEIWERMQELGTL